MSNKLDPVQARHFVWPELGPNCLKRLSADDASRQLGVAFGKVNVISKERVNYDFTKFLFLHCLRLRDTKGSTCLLRHILTENLGMCQYVVCITGNTTFKK